jgi:hypothetical protein
MRKQGLLNKMTDKINLSPVKASGMTFQRKGEHEFTLRACSQIYFCAVINVTLRISFL